MLGGQFLEKNYFSNPSRVGLKTNTMSESHYRHQEFLNFGRSLAQNLNVSHHIDLSCSMRFDNLKRLQTLIIHAFQLHLMVKQRIILCSGPQFLFCIWTYFYLIIPEKENNYFPTFLRLREVPLAKQQLSKSYLYIWVHQSFVVFFLHNGKNLRLIKNVFF